MKLMIISDIHGSYDDLSKVLNIYKKESFDKLIILGDILYHGPRNDLPVGYAPKKVIPALNAMKNEIIAVRGNCDAEVDQMVLEFPILQDETKLFIDHHTFYLTHGHHHDKDHLPLLNKGDILMYGHYHVPLCEIKEDYYIFNPSSISLPKQGEKSYGVYENNTLSIYTLDQKLVKQMSIL